MVSDSFSNRDQSNASVECASCGQHKKAKLLACNKCEGTYWCKSHWADWDPHKPKYGMSASHQQLSVAQSEWLQEIDREVFQHPDEEEHSEQHQQNLPTYWFGMNYKDETAQFNNSVYGDIILSSRFRDKTKQFPSLVSFIGATGAGKSTLIRAIINYVLRGEDGPEASTGSSFWAPIAGLKAATLPTSSDVHLYHDPATIHTDRPILFADSEGLSGGNQTPAAAVELGKHIKHFARKYILRKDTGPSLSRSYCVEHIYPRILYAFSDILCYVIQQDPRIVESLITRMISWADNARHASLNQVTLPRVVLVLNKVSMDEREQKRWDDVPLATKRVVEGLKNCYQLSGELQAIADRWNGILKEEEKVHSIMDLFLRYFKSISIVYIPPRGRTQDTSEFYGQVRQLRQHILTSSQEVRADRLRSLGQLNSGVLESLFHTGLDHFFSELDKPFDFFDFMMASRPSPKTIVANATYLMMRMKETELNPIELDERCAKLFSSYRTMKILSESIPGCSLKVEETIFTEPFRSAYIDFYTSSRCWFHVNGRQCQNTREGHTKGHLDPDGELIASGDYYTPFKEESCDNFIRAIVNHSRGSISLLKSLAAASQDPKPSVVRGHLQALKNEREFWKVTFSSKTCFSCLAEPPDFVLSCGHTICHSCVKVFGNQVWQETAYDLGACPLCSEGTQFEEPLAHIQLKPDEAGVRVLAIDGGGVRGVISARILQLLEYQIGLNLPIFHFFDLIIGTSSGGILSLALGTNLWSADRCLHEFKKMAKGMFKKRVAAKPPILGYILAWALTDSYYDEYAIEEALREAFSAPDCLGSLFEEPYTSNPNSHTRAMTDLKVGVTAVNAITELTTLMTNYNRKTSDDDNGRPHIYRQDDNYWDIVPWVAGRCTSAAPSVFPVYRAADGHAYQDGGLNENNPIKAAMMEAPSLWHRNSRVDVALSIGTGWADKRIAEYGVLKSHAVHGWLKRCIDCFESKLDSERLWQEYRQTLDEDGRARHHRLNAKLPYTLPFLADTSAVQKMDDTTKAFFEEDENHRQLQGAAEALLASLFYVSVDGPTESADGRYLFTALILCRLERKHQPALMRRLERSNCVFRVHEGAVDIDFVAQESRFMEQESFRQPVQWVGHLREEFHVRLVFGEDTSIPVQQPPDSTTTRAVQYDVSGSPFRNSL